jgi:Tfp pilus assembly major pilin PilA
MKRILLAGLLVAGSAFGAYAQSDPAAPMKLSAAECASLWNQASPNGGPITEQQASAYVTDFKAANPDGDTTIEKIEFTKACGSGLVKSGASTGAGTGEAGTGMKSDQPAPKKY